MSSTVVEVGRGEDVPVVGLSHTAVRRVDTVELFPGRPVRHLPHVDHDSVPGRISGVHSLAPPTVADVHFVVQVGPPAHDAFELLYSDALVEFDLLVDAAAAASTVFTICGALTSLVVALLVASVGQASIPHSAASATASSVTPVVQLSINGGGV